MQPYFAYWYIFIHSSHKLSLQHVYITTYIQYKPTGKNIQQYILFESIEWEIWTNSFDFMSLHTYIHI